MRVNTIRVGGASGFWGEAAMATSQLLKDSTLDYLVYDYLAEITMSILARARAANPDAGFATDFVSAAMAPNLRAIAAQRVRVVANAGGVNPAGCARALQSVIDAQGLSLKVAVVTGDDLFARAHEFHDAGITELYSDTSFPEPQRVASINAYLGAFPIAAALSAGADIVITGRVVDSAVTLGACIHAFGWRADELDKLAGGSLAGHILECGPQATGGNFTDWESIADGIAEIGYPIAEIDANASFVVSKPTGTGGLVSPATVGEQLLYEIGDPQAYILPDVTCDFSDVRLEQTGTDLVRVSGARGRPAPRDFKVSATFADGFRAGQTLLIYGERANHKARRFGEAALQRAAQRLQREGLPPFAETLIELIGDESNFGANSRIETAREVLLKVAARHPDKRGIAALLQETIGAALAGPPGLTGFAGARPKPSPVVRLFSFLVNKASVPISVTIDGDALPLAATDLIDMPDAIVRPAPPGTAPSDPDWPTVPLLKLAWARSGDKGDKANVGVIARRPEHLPLLWQALSEQVVAECFRHVTARPVERFLLPGLSAINFLLHDVLGGGGIASLRDDPQGKGYAQVLLALPIRVPPALAKELG